jgi:hypothetical protein
MDKIRKRTTVSLPEYMLIDLGTKARRQGIGYGGVDEEGTKDPASCRQFDVWADEEDTY